MVDLAGVCSICARVCHRGHEITYAKHGSFFCDCGAKEDGSCQVRIQAKLCTLHLCLMYKVSLKSVGIFIVHRKEALLDKAKMLA